MEIPNQLEINKEEILDKLDDFINQHRFLIDIKKLIEIENLIKDLH